MSCYDGPCWKCYGEGKVEESPLVMIDCSICEGKGTLTLEHSHHTIYYYSQDSQWHKEELSEVYDWTFCDRCDKVFKDE